MSFTHVNGAVGTHTVSAASVAVTITGVTPGDLVLVGLAASSTTSTLTFACSDGSNTYVRDVVSPYANNLYVMIFRSIVTVGGTLVITVTPSASCILTIGADEYSFFPGATIALDGTTGQGTGNASTQATSNLAPTTTGLVYGVSTGQLSNIGALTQGTGFAGRFNYSPSGSTQVPLLCEDIVANTTSPIAVVTTSSIASHYSIVGVAYKEIITATGFEPAAMHFTF